MTKSHFKRLPVGTPVWFQPHYLAFAFPGIVKRIHGRKGIWVNFFGDGQCFFVLKRPQQYESVFELGEK